jgi:hypothetical protein
VFLQPRYLDEHLDESPHRCLGQQVDISHTVLQDAEDFVLKSAQTEVYQEEIDCLHHKTPVGRRSTIANLNPFLDEKGLLRVGGRNFKTKSSAS